MFINILKVGKFVDIQPGVDRSHMDHISLN